jgi:hypothetical protein
MRRELKLLLIEMNMLRVEVEQLRSMEKEARKTEAFLTTSISGMMESRDQWRREAERLRAVIEQVPPWSLLKPSRRGEKRPTGRGALPDSSNLNRGAPVPFSRKAFAADAHQ